MNAQDLDLASLRKPLQGALIGYESLCRDLKFEEFPDLVLTMEKPNSARTVIPVSYADANTLDMYVIVFLPGDGTGDTNTYQLEQLKLPKRLRYDKKPERVIPRSKKGVICEGFFPLFSIGCDDRINMFDTYLEELVLTSATSPPTIVHGWNLGRDNPIRGESANVPRIYFTAGEKNGKRFGDPHAVHYPKEYDNGIQVAGFLAVRKIGHPILGTTEKWILPPEYRQ